MLYAGGLLVSGLLMCSVVCSLVCRSDRIYSVIHKLQLYVQLRCMLQPTVLSDSFEDE